MKHRYRASQTVILAATVILLALTAGWYWSSGPEDGGVGGRPTGPGVSGSEPVTPTLSETPSEMTSSMTAMDSRPFSGAPLMDALALVAVMDEDRRPLKGARILADLPGAREVTAEVVAEAPVTDDQGMCAVPILDSTAFTVCCAGYVPRQLAALQAGSRVEVSLKRGLRYSALFLDSDGFIAAGVRVRASRARMPLARYEPARPRHSVGDPGASIHEAWSDRRGEVLLGDLTPGTWRIEIVGATTLPGEFPRVRELHLESDFHEVITMVEVHVAAGFLEPELVAAGARWIEEALRPGEASDQGWRDGDSAGQLMAMSRFPECQFVRAHVGAVDPNRMNRFKVTIYAPRIGQATVELPYSPMSAATPRRIGLSDLAPIVGEGTLRVRLLDPDGREIQGVGQALVDAPTGGPLSFGAPERLPIPAGTYTVLPYVHSIGVVKRPGGVRVHVRPGEDVVADMRLRERCDVMRIHLQVDAAVSVDLMSVRIELDGHAPELVRGRMEPIVLCVPRGSSGRVSLLDTTRGDSVLDEAAFAGPIGEPSIDVWLGSRAKK